MISDNKVNEVIETFRKNGLVEYPCASWDKPPEQGLKHNFGYCTYSLNMQPHKSKQGSSDPGCSRYCAHKAPSKILNIINRELLIKGPLKVSAICRNIKENDTKQKELSVIETV